jgi:hypothetical protein
MGNFWRGILEREKRAQVWVFFISVTYISCFVGGPCPQNELFNTLIYAFFADLGITVGSKVVKNDNRVNGK